MKQQNYHSSINIPVSPAEAFQSISNRISEWWATNFEGSGQNLHDIFTVRFGKTFGAMKIIDIVPGRKIVWQVIDCYLDVFKNKTQWTGTTLVWEISADNDSTQISITHVGLTPELECYADCERGWDFFMKESLFKLLTEGKGLPGTGIHATIVNGHRTYEGVLFYKNDPLPDFPDGSIIIDVKETRGEEVISFYSINKFDRQSFNPSYIKGEYYMIVENKSLFGKIQPLKDLLETVQ